MQILFVDWLYENSEIQTFKRNITSTNDGHVFVNILEEILYCLMKQLSEFSKILLEWIFRNTTILCSPISFLQNKAMTMVKLPPKSVLICVYSAFLHKSKHSFHDITLIFPQNWNWQCILRIERLKVKKVLTDQTDKQPHSTWNASYPWMGQGRHHGFCFWWQRALETAGCFDWSETCRGQCSRSVPSVDTTEECCPGETCWIDRSTPGEGQGSRKEHGLSL